MNNFLQYLDKKLSNIDNIKEDFVGAERVVIHGTDKLNDTAYIYRNPITEKEISEIISEDKTKSELAGELYEEAKFWPGVRIGIVNENDAYFWPSVYLIEDIEKTLGKKFIINLVYENDTKTIHDADIDSNRGIHSFSDEKRNILLNSKFAKKRLSVNTYDSNIKEVSTNLISVFPLGTKYVSYMRMPADIEREMERVTENKIEYNWYLDEKFAILDGGNNARI